MVLKASDSFMHKIEYEAQGIMFQFSYEKHRGFGFKDAGPGLKFSSLGCARVSLHLD